MSRLSDLINGTTSTVPQPYKVAFVAESNKTVIVQCDRYREMYEVAEFLRKERGGVWWAGFWTDQGHIGGHNPFQDAHGVWCYLMVS